MYKTPVKECYFIFAGFMENRIAVFTGDILGIIHFKLSMSGITALCTGSRRHNNKERRVANADRLESVQLCRRLRFLGVQHQRELARVCGAQMELRKALDRLRGHGSSSHPILTRPAVTSTSLTPVQPHSQLVVQSCCPNHIICSSCNLRLRLADTVTRRFTPGLWTMYCPPLTTAHTENSQSMVYYIPSFIQKRNLSSLDKSLRYLPFM